MPFTISSVIPSAEVESLVADFHIDVPLSGAADEGYLLQISGWVLPEDEPIQSIEVHEQYRADRLQSGGFEPKAVVGESRLNVPRPDVVAAFPGRGAPVECGFSVLLPTFLLEKEFTLVVEARTDRRRIRLVEIAGTRSTLQPPTGTDGPSPLLLTTYGRSGSSWFAHLLRSHPQIAVGGEWGYEVRACGRWLGELRDRLGNPHGIEFGGFALGSGSAWVGNNPFGEPTAVEWYQSTFVRDEAVHARETISSFYRSLFPGRRLFVEKCSPDAMITLAFELFPGAKEIFLVRDPRDQFASILAFDAKRGFAGFGRDQVPSDLEYVRAFADRLRPLAAAARHRPQSLVLRYEDLIADPRESLGRVLRHLDVNDGADVVEGLLTSAQSAGDHAEHRTIPDAASTVGRWRTTLRPDLAELAEDLFADALDAFGYEP